MNKLFEKLQFDKINIEYLVAVIFLGAALIVGTCQGVETLAGNIVSGMFGYIGGRMSANKENADFAPKPTNDKRKENFADSVKQGAE